MVAFVSGGGVGLLDSSAAVLGQRGVVGAAAGGQAGEGAYVNTATGNLVLQHRDDYLAAGGADLVMTRTYNAQGKLTDDNGDNWQLGLVLSADGKSRPIPDVRMPETTPHSRHWRQCNHRFR